MPDEAVDAFLATVGHGTEQSLLAAELRQLGGALGRPHHGAGALPQLDGQFVLFGVAIAATPEMGAAGHADANALVAAMAPWANGRQYLNFLEEPGDPRAGYDADSFGRLQALRTSMDPDGTLMANHHIAADTITLPHQR
jgi:hypothetical protein